MSTKTATRINSPRLRGITPIRGETAASDPIDWGPLADAARVGAEWMLDRAAAMVTDYPEEADAVERVRVFMHARLAGIALPLAVEDLLFVMGLVIQRLGEHVGVADAAAELADPIEAALRAMRMPLDAVVPLRHGLRPLIRRCPGPASARVVRDPYIHAAA